VTSNTHVYEDSSGVLLIVKYDDSTSPWTLESIHATDHTYQACGPDLSEMLDNMVVVVDGTRGTPYLNNMFEEILNGRK
jgi:hypothetical protein